MQNYRLSGNFGRKAGSGNWKISTPEQDARLVAEVDGNPFHTARNRLRATNLRSRRAINTEVHKEEHIEERLIFAMGNDDRDWKKGIFLTKSPFLVHRKDPLLYIVLLAPDSTTDIPPFVVEYLCRVGGGFLVVEWAQSLHSREIQPAEISTVAGTPYGSLC